MNRTTNTSREGFSRSDVSNILEDFKNDILSSLIYKLDALQENKRKEEEDQALSIFPYMQKKEPSQELYIRQSGNIPFV